MHDCTSVMSCGPSVPTDTILKLQTCIRGGANIPGSNSACSGAHVRPQSLLDNFLNTNSALLCHS